MGNTGYSSDMELTHSHAAADTAPSTRAEKLLLLLLSYHAWDLSTFLVQKVTNTSVVVMAALPAEVQQWSCVGRQEHGFFFPPPTVAVHAGVRSSLELQL